MRAILAIAATGLVLAGCNKKEGAASNTVAAAATPTASSTAAPAGFTPPTSISRADYGGKIERRFRKLDKNGDNKLERDELPPKRADKLIRKGDKNGDGTLDASEWSALMLQKFDKRDANHDGNLTSDEKGGKKGGGRRAGKRDRDGNDGFDDDSDEVDNGV
jgi:hypothetical protein